MDDEEKWKYIVDLDEELLQGGVILSEWSVFLIKDTDIAFCNGAYLATILTAISGIETQLRHENCENTKKGKKNLYELIENSGMDDEVKGRLHHLRKYRNKWVHVHDPFYDREILDSPEKLDHEIEKMAYVAVRLLREVIYYFQWI